MKKRTLLVIGLGKFGMSFLENVRTGEFEVIAVDVNEQLVDRIAPWIERAVVLDATDREALERIGASEADTAVVSVGGAIDQSILAVLHLRHLGVSDIYVKAASDDHARVLELIGATRIIRPEREVAEQLAESLKHPSLRQYLPLLGDYAVVETLVPNSFVGKTLPELHLRQRYDVSVIAIGPSNDRTRLTAPSVEAPLRAGDLLVLIGQRKALDRFDLSMRK